MPGEVRQSALALLALVFQKLLQRITRALTSDEQL